MADHSTSAFDETGALLKRQRESLVKRILLVSWVIVLLNASSIAHAQVMVDVTKITCHEFVNKYEIADPNRSPFGSTAIIMEPITTRLLTSIKRYKASTN